MTRPQELLAVAGEQADRLQVAGVAADLMVRAVMAPAYYAETPMGGAVEFRSPTVPGGSQTSGGSQPGGSQGGGRPEGGPRPKF